MTCIVGLVSEGVVYIGGDSATNSGTNTLVRRDKKVFRVGHAVIGCTTSFRMTQILAYKLTLPAMPKGMDLMEYMATSFIDEVRVLLSKNGFAQNISGRESGGVFLVGINGRLFSIYDDFQVGESAYDYAAIGCGEYYAMGAMRNTSQLEPKKRILAALETAQEFSSYVRAPFIIEKSTKS